MTRTMKAMLYSKYGSADDVRVQDVPRPTPKPGEVVVAVRAASVNLSDWEMLTGTPLYARVWGLWKPRFRTLGSDVAGEVVATGAGVTDLVPGDRVFGDIMGHFGGFAEYACAPAGLLHRLPRDMPFEDAAAVPQAAVIALRGICDRGQVSAGQQVLINGAGGGSGTFAIQLAKSRGAVVIGVDNSEKQQFMRSVGADRVVDYTCQDFSRTNERYDLILDLVAHRSVFACRRMLSPSGKYLVVGGRFEPTLQAAILGPLVSRFGSRQLGMLAVAPKPNDFHRVGELLDAGTIKPVIDRCFPLADVAEALRYVGEGHALGKVVVRP